MQPVSFDVDLVAIMAGGLVFIIWFVRLEAKVMYQDKELVRVESKVAEVEHATKERDAVVWDKLDHLQDTMNQILQTLAAVQTKLEK